MKRELVKCLRTVALLAMFSQDSDTVVNIKGCLQSMSFMEPDLILHPILERAVPSLEALVEVCALTWVTFVVTGAESGRQTQRTIAVIKALGAVIPAIVSRDVYYPGAKHLVPILQLLIPGIDVVRSQSFCCLVTMN
jgi:proteasome activator subunit 4